MKGELTEEDFEWMHNHLLELEEESKHWPKWMKAQVKWERRDRMRQLESQTSPKPDTRPKLRLIRGGKNN